jgi:hypothetical protein
VDEDRRIRFLVAPTLFVASLLWGAISDQTARDLIYQVLKTLDWSKLIGLLAGGGIVVFAAGYIFGTIGYFFLRLLFRFRPKKWGKSRFHEVAFSEDSFKKVWKRFNPSETPDRQQELSAGVAFDHGLLRGDYEGIHRWLFRRWNAFSIAITSFCALVLSVPFGLTIVNIPFNYTWGIPVAVFASILLVMAYWAWNDTMNMLDFMAGLPPKQTSLLS